MASVKSFCLVLSFSILVLMPLPARSADPTPASSESSSGRVARQLQLIERQQSELEAHYRELEQEKHSVERELEQQRSEVEQLKQELGATSQKAESAQREAQTVSARVETDARKFSLVEKSFSQYLPSIPVAEFGFRQGYSGFPFGQRNGGFVYGGYMSFHLLDQRDGLPFGNLDGDVMIGVANSGVDSVPNTNLFGQKQVLNVRQTMWPVWFSVKYFLDLWKPYGFRPYVDGGPMILADFITSSPLVVGQVPSGSGLKKRGIPVVGGGNLYEGLAGGAGIEKSFAGTGIPIVDRLTVGFDYKISYIPTGDSWNMFTFHLTFVPRTSPGRSLLAW